MENEEQRKSKRGNAGVPPERLGVQPSLEISRVRLGSAGSSSNRSKIPPPPPLPTTNSTSTGEGTVSGSSESAVTIQLKSQPRSTNTPPASSTTSKRSTASNLARRKQLADLKAKEEQIKLRSEQIEIDRMRAHLNIESDESDSEDERRQGVIKGLDDDEKAKLADFGKTCSMIGAGYKSSLVTTKDGGDEKTEELLHKLSQLRGEMEADNQLAGSILKSLASNPWDPRDEESRKTDIEIQEHKEKEAEKAKILEENAKEIRARNQKVWDERDALRLKAEKDASDLIGLHWKSMEKEKARKRLEEEVMESLMNVKTPTSALSTAGEHKSKPETTTELSTTGRIEQESTTTRPPPIPTTISSDPMQQMVLAITEAFKNVVPNAASPTTLGASSTTDKFLARQSYGKDLPYFSGRPEEWPTFISSYTNSTTICGFSDSENLMRLQKCLKGEAAKSVLAFMTTPNNMKEIMEILQTRYGQPKLIIKSLIEKARGLPNFKEDRLDSFIEFGTAIQNLTATIKSLKMDEHLKNPVLVDELEQKLPVPMRMAWATWVEDDPIRIADLDTLNSWISRRVKIACSISPLKIKVDEKEKADDNHQRRRGNRVFVVADQNTTVSSNDNKKSGDKKCIHCDKTGFNIQSCREFKQLSPQERYQLVVEKRLCFGCLNKGHSSRSCNNKKVCGKDGCEKFHHSLIHTNSTPPPSKPTVSTVQKLEEAEAVEPSKAMSHSEVHLNAPVQDDYYFAIVPLTLKGPKKSVEIYAMLDQGSRYTLLDSDIAQEIGLKETPINLSFTGFGCATKTIPSSLVDVDLCNEKSGTVYHATNIHTFRGIILPDYCIEEELLKKNPHLQNLGFKVQGPKKVSMLIGNSQYDLILPNRIAKAPKSLPRSPIGVRCSLGWYIAGKIPGKGTKQNDVFHIYGESICEDDQLHHLVKQHFSTEDFGVCVKTKNLRSREDLMAQELTNKHMRKVNGSWETGLLWRNPEIVLPKSKDMALKRLYSIERKMDRDPVFAEKYCSNIQHYLDTGYIMKVPQEDLNVVHPRLWYLPHFAVSKSNKPGKIRTVFDAAATSRGTSLNDNLLTGPDLVNPLPSVLAKFRQRKIAVTADIKEMFHRIKISKVDRHSQRLLWRGLDRKSEPQEYYMTVMTFGAACSPYCAQEAKNRNALKHADEFPEAAKAIINRFYVDNYLDSFDTIEEAYRLYEGISEIHRRGDFLICYWTTNNIELAQKIPVEVRADTQKSIEVDNGNLTTERILGLLWDPKEDVFTYTVSLHRIKQDVLDGERVPTKREALSAVMSVYDPLGFVAPLTIKAKILLQDAWRTHIDWDDELPTSIHHKWNLWISELRKISEVKIPRCYSEHFSSSNKVQLHVFCDASESAFASVAYFRVESANQIDVSLAMAKSKVAPLKTLSISRMELQAAVMGSRILKTLHEIHEVKIHQNFLWTDSRIVFCWLKADGKQFLQFVSHRIGEIQESTDVADWHWISGKNNVADEATRDWEECQLHKNSRWINGPDFLKTPQETWVVKMPEKPTEVKVEMKKQFIFTINNAMQYEKPDQSRFSSWLRLIRSTAFMYRAIEIWKRKSKFQEALSVEEVQAAEKQWWIWSQMESYPKEYKALKEKVILSDGQLNAFSPYLDDDGVIRMKGRVQADVETGAMERNPVILNSKHPYTVLLIKHFHERNGHHGQEQVVNLLHEKYCIPLVRVAVRSAWIKCQHCRNRKVMPAAPEMGELPAARLYSRVPPFSYTGVDYFGSYLVTVGRSHQKRYGALFTCLSTRAIHLEVAHSLSTDSFLMALNRFISRRGNPREIFSDNGTNFVGANNELQKCLQEMDTKAIQDKLANRGIKWNFNPPLSPHMGGIWERLVRSVKVALDSLFTCRNPKEEAFLTMMTEVEGMLNGRPITHVSNDPEDFEALTPNHFLLGSSGNARPVGKFCDQDLYRPREQWKMAQRLADQFWTRWLQKYVPTLRKRDKWTTKRQQVKVGDLVVVNDEELPRRHWHLGRILQVFPGPDGIVRKVKIKTSRGIYKRPVTRIGVLDVFDELNPLDSVFKDNNAAAMSSGGGMSSTGQLEMFRAGKQFVRPTLTASVGPKTKIIPRTV